MTVLPNINAKYWTEADARAMGIATNFNDLVAIALRIISKLPQPLGQVCGPITTGGLGSAQANMRRFRQVIQELHRLGIVLFDQCVFEARIYEIAAGEWSRHHNTRLLEDFYHPILSSGHVKTLYFISGWESSHGASWEHEQGLEHGLEIIYLPA